MMDYLSRRLIWSDMFSPSMRRSAFSVTRIGFSLRWRRIRILNRFWWLKLWLNATKINFINNFQNRWNCPKQHKKPVCVEVYQIKIVFIKLIDTFILSKNSQNKSRVSATTRLPIYIHSQSTNRFMEQILYSFRRISVKINAQPKFTLNAIFFFRPCFL